MNSAKTKKGCIFCRKKADSSDLIGNNKHAYAIRDAFPVTEGHVLIIPRRHFADFFDMTKKERESVFRLLDRTRKNILSMDKRVEGFNIGINSGAAAGQTVMHCHIHLIPRRKGDMKDPRGGIRNLIFSANNRKYLRMHYTRKAC